MLRQAAEKYNIDLSKSWFIGDTTMDIQTGVNAGMRTVLVLTGEAGKDNRYDLKPTLIADTLEEAVDDILHV
jgi:phosphoglycolate phosphatase-like HAD superfamily hydrolase